MGSQVDSGVVHADYHAFWLSEQEIPAPEPRPWPTNGIISTQPGAAQIWAGTHTGNVQISVDVRDDPPSDLELTSWDDVVEVSLESTHGRVRVTSFFAALPRELPVLSGSGPGWYRVRVYVRGRDSGGSYDSAAPDEEFLIVTWPTTDYRPDVLYKQTDRYGQQVREVAEQQGAVRLTGPDLSRPQRKDL